VEKSAELQETI